MKKMLTGFILLHSLVAVAPNSLADNDGDLLIIPLHVHIVSGLNMQKENIVMPNWITTTDIHHVVLPELNSIWQPANIEFAIETVEIHPAVDAPDKAQTIEYIVNAGRDAAGESDPVRIQKLDSLINWQHHSDSAVNVYLVPYLGEASQGNAKPRLKRVYVGQWSDKASKAKRPPTRFPLVEPRPFKHGSLSRTVAHELGHILGLKHPDKNTQAEDRLLMGGVKPGYELTASEIKRARHRARKLLKEFQTNP